MNDILFEALKLLIMVITLVFTRYAIPWIKLQVDDKKMQMICEWVNKAVLSAQQTLQAKTGAERKAVVKKFIAEMLASKTISISDAQLDALIESAVYIMKEESKGPVTNIYDYYKKE